MNLFNAQESFTVPSGPGGSKRIRKAILTLFEFHQTEFTEDPSGEFRFRVPAFVLSGRNKPLHRFQHGVIGLRDLPDGQAEISFDVRLSKPNIISCFGSVLLGLAISAAMIAGGETPLWWALAAAGAGFLIAYTAKDQCVSRLKKDLLEAATLARGSV